MTEEVAVAIAVGAGSRQVAVVMVEAPHWQVAVATRMAVPVWVLPELTTSISTSHQP